MTETFTIRWYTRFGARSCRYLFAQKIEREKNNISYVLINPLIRQCLHESGLISILFHDFETASKSMRFGSVYTKSLSPENENSDGISERCTTC